MPIAVVIAAFLSFMVAVGVRNMPHRVPTNTPTPTGSVIAPTSGSSDISATPSSTVSYLSGTQRPTSSGTLAKTPTPTVASQQNRTNTSTPTPTIRVISNTATPTNTPVPADSAAPTLDWMTGPTDGSITSSTSFCFPMKYSDASMPIYVRHAFDSDTLGDWGQNYAPCYQNVSNGSHSFSVQAKDAKGNTTGTIKQSFTIQVATPTQSSTTTPSPSVTYTP